MRFESPWAFLILFFIPIVIILSKRRNTGASIKFSALTNAKRLKGSRKQKLIKLPLFLRIIVLICLSIVLARPQKGKEHVRDLSKGVAIEMVIDRSGSMAAEMDFEWQRLNRLEVVKKVFSEFVIGKSGTLAGRPNDLIGMIGFAKYSDTISPLTLAHGALSQFIEQIQLVKNKSEDGTAIGDAIALAAARLKTSEETLALQNKSKRKDFEIKSKIIILLTDGQNNAGMRSPLEAAELAKKWGIKIYSIGVGGNEGLMRQNSFFGSFLIQAGAGVDKQMLTSIAEITGGMFRMAEDGESLRAIYKEIDNMERSEIESVRYLDYQEMFKLFLYAALLLLLMEIILKCTVFRRIP